MGDLYSKLFFDGGFYFGNSRIIKLFDGARVNTNKVIVLVEPERPLELSTIASKIVFDQQVTVKQQFDGIIKCGTAYPVLVVFHSDVECFHIKVPLGIVDLSEDCESFRSFSVLFLLEIFYEQSSYRIERKVPVFHLVIHDIDLLSYYLVKIKINSGQK